MNLRKFTTNIVSSDAGKSSFVHGTNLVVSSENDILNFIEGNWKFVLLIVTQSLEKTWDETDSTTLEVVGLWIGCKKLVF